MAWENELVAITRVLINDLDSTPTFTDNRLRDTIATSALLVAQEIDLGQTYTISVSPSGNIDPDPTLTDTKDDIAVVLFPLKAACIIDQNRLQGAAGNAIRIRDGDSEIDLSVGFRGFRDILEFGPCHSYEVLLKDIETSRAFIGEGILGPFSSDEFVRAVPGVFDAFARRLGRLSI